MTNEAGETRSASSYRLKVRCLRAEAAYQDGIGDSSLAAELREAADMIEELSAGTEKDNGNNPAG